MKIENTTAYRYAKWCAESGSLRVPKYVRKQAEKWLDIADGKREGLKVSMAKYEVIRRLLMLMTHPDLQCPMYRGLEPYALFLITATFCTIRADGRRLYETVILEICRKNYKTYTIGTLFIILMMTEQN